MRFLWSQLPCLVFKPAYYCFRETDTISECIHIKTISSKTYHSGAINMWKLKAHVKMDVITWSNKKFNIKERKKEVNNTNKWLKQEIKLLWKQCLASFVSHFLSYFVIIIHYYIIKLNQMYSLIVVSYSNISKFFLGPPYQSQNTQHTLVWHRILLCNNNHFNEHCLETLAAKKTRHWRTC